MPNRALLTALTGLVCLQLACAKQPGSSLVPDDHAAGGSGGLGGAEAMQSPDWRESECPWPGPGRAALSLTYDDSMSSHLSTAVPALNARGLRGTFFLNRVASDAAWSALLASGHELGAHTPTHPCPASNGVPGGDLETYDLDSFALELDADLAQLKRLGAPEPYTFAYPCGATWVGDAHDSYVPLVAERFAAARLAGPGPTTADVDLHQVPAQFDLKTKAELEQALDQAVARGQWLVLGFHGIGGDWLVTDAAVHEEFLQGLAERRDVWVAPFGEVASCVKSAR